MASKRPLVSFLWIIFSFLKGHFDSLFQNNQWRRCFRSSATGSFPSTQYLAGLSWDDCCSHWFFFFFFYAILQPNAPHLIKIHYILSFSLTSCFYLTPMLPVVYSNRRRWSLAKQLGLDVFTWLPHQTMFSCRIQLKREPENFVTGLFLFIFGHHRTHTLSLSLKCLEFTSY